MIRALSAHRPHQRLIDTGQLYDAALSDVFFRGLDLPEPGRNLGVGFGSHAGRTAAIMVSLEPILSECDVALVVYGDVNSTAAAALVAAKLYISAAHGEAGLRSDDRRGREALEEAALAVTSRLQVIEPLGYLDFIALADPGSS